MKLLLNFFTLLFLFILSACTTDICPDDSITYVDNAALLAPNIEPTYQNIELEINRKTILFDQVVHGPLCNNSLEGTVYIACDVQITRWEEKPDFLEGCNFQVAEGTVIYVAAHNNAPYYKGCKECH